MTQPSTDLIGQMVGKFKIIALLGEGSMGVVYEAEDTTLARHIALKVLNLRYTIDPVDVERFKREARSAAQLKHPHIVTIYEVGQVGPLYYIAMDYIRGRTLADVMQQEGAMSVTRIIGLLQPVASALDAAHAHQIIHRDIKPSNIMVSNEGHVYLMDFGIARNAAAAQATDAGMVLGTPIYMSPEQARGAAQIDPATDIYALGVMIYQMLSGKLPFEGATTMLTLFARLQDPPRPLHDVLPAIDPGLEQVVMRALALNPHDRYATAGEFIAALQPYAGVAPALPTGSVPSQTIVVPPPPGGLSADAQSAPVPVQSPGTPGSRKKSPVLLFIGLLLLVLGGGALAFALDLFPPGLLPPGLTSTSTPGVVTTAPATPTVAAGATAVPATIARPGGTLLQNQIVYVLSSNGDTNLAVMQPDGTMSELLAVTSGAAHPAIAPDGSKLAFDRQGDIYIINADASGLTNLTGGAGTSAYPAWSPDGTQIAFVQDRTIYIMNADGSAGVAITSRAQDYRNLVWAAAGDQLLAFELDGDIYVMQPDGTGLTNLSSRPDSREGEPAWSPDGTQIAFASDRGAASFDIYVMTATGTNIQRLTDAEQDDTAPAWSPDGTQMVFHTRRDRNDELYVMNADGSNQTNMTNTPDSDETMAVWSPRQ